MGDMKIQKRYNEYLECLGDNITDTEKLRTIYISIEVFNKTLFIEIFT